MCPAASSGDLDVDQRTQLLSEWAPSEKASQKQLEKARPEIEKLQRAREETASNPRDQRYMPSDQEEAQRFAARDEEEAQLVAKRSVRSKRLSRSLSTRAGVSASAARAEASLPQLASPILKKRRGGGS